MQHIGLVGCSAEGAALCYRTICLEGERTLGKHPEISTHTHSLRDYVRCLERGDLEGVADLMLSSAEKLARAGADFLICPDNTIHIAMNLVAPRAPRPWLHIADVVAARAAELGAKKVALTGTRWLVDADVYPDELEAHDIAFARPRPDERDEIDRIIMDELVCGVIEPASRARVVAIIARLAADEGCDAVVLGCTELPLIVDETISPVPPLDSTRLLARAALARAAG